MTESAALQELYGANLRPQIKRAQHDTVPKGTAIGTDPAAGTSLDPNSEVVLNISEGPSAVKVPESLPGKTEAAARDVLRQSGLVGAPTTTMANSSTVPGGIVITTSPAPGQMVAVGQHRGDRGVHRQGGHAGTARPHPRRGGGGAEGTGPASRTSRKWRTPRWRQAG